MFAAPAGVHWATRFAATGATAARVHHMLLLGCAEVPDPPDEAGVSVNYRCGMGEAAPCRGGQHQGFLFGWGKGSAGLELPAGVGFRIGSETSMQYLVVQVRLSPPPRYNKQQHQPNPIHQPTFDRAAGPLRGAAAGFERRLWV